MESLIGPIDEVCSRFPGRWVIVEIVRHDPPALEPQEVRAVGAVATEEEAYDLAGQDPLRRLVQYGLTPMQESMVEVVPAR